MNQCEIRPLHQSADLSLAIVAQPLGRTRAWLSKVELGRIRASRQTLSKIAAAIQRLEKLRKQYESHDLSDLKL